MCDLQCNSSVDIFKDIIEISKTLNFPTGTNLNGCLLLTEFNNRIYKTGAVLYDNFEINFIDKPPSQQTKTCLKTCLKPTIEKVEYVQS